MLPISRCILAIDSGGSKCDAVLVRDDGTLLGQGHCTWNDPHSGRSQFGSGRSENSVRKAVLAALGDIRCDELVFATYRDNFGLGKLVWKYTQTLRFFNATEHEPILFLNHVPEGIVVIAGTGGAVYCKWRGRRPTHFDGLGPVLGDAGSGYHIGLLALRAIAKSTWHPRHATSLTSRVMQALNLTDPSLGRKNLVQFSLNNPDRAEVASLAALVDCEANAGDAIAQEILRQAADAMTETIFDAVSSLGLAEEEFPLVGAGSVAVHSTRYWEHLCTQVSTYAPRAIPMRSSLPPVLGMALLVLQKYGTDEYARMEHRLLEQFTA